MRTITSLRHQARDAVTSASEHSFQLKLQGDPTVRKRPALIAAATVLSMVPAIGFTYGAEAAAPQSARAVAPMFTPDPNGILGLVLACFPSTIQADMQLMLDGNIWPGLQALFVDVANLTPAQLSDIMTKLQSILGGLTGTSPSPSPSAASSTTAATLASLLKGGLTQQKALQILLTASS
jgi:hypothetical protein